MPPGWDRKAPSEVMLPHAQQACPSLQGSEVPGDVPPALGLVKETSMGLQECQKDIKV